MASAADDRIEDAMRRFAEAASPEGDAAVWTPRLRDVLERALSTGWTIDLRSFAETLARHAKNHGDAAAYLEAARAEDLALAHACAAGDARALSAFERSYFGEVDRALSKVRRGKLDRDDIAQRVRERLFVATEERQPRIADYAGQGDLKAWFRVAATRLILNEATKPTRDEATEDEELAMVPTNVADPELELLRRKYSAEFKAAFARTLETMEARDKAILGYSVVQKLGIDAIAEIYDVHRATAARWVQKARDALVAGVRGDLEVHLKVPQQELESILRLVADEVEVSVRRLL